MEDLLPNGMTQFLVMIACIFGMVAAACSFSFVVYAQTPAAQNQVNITDILIDSYPYISVEYEDSSNVVIKADEESLLLVNGTLTPFWEAIDKAQENGFKLDDIPAWEAREIQRDSMLSCLNRMSLYCSFISK